MEEKERQKSVQEDAEQQCKEKIRVEATICALESNAHTHYSSSVRRERGTKILPCSPCQKGSRGQKPKQDVISAAKEEESSRIT